MLTIVLLILELLTFKDPNLHLNSPDFLLTLPLMHFTPTSCVRGMPGNLTIPIVTFLTHGP